MNIIEFYGYVYITILKRETSKVLFAMNSNFSNRSQQQFILLFILNLSLIYRGKLPQWQEGLVVRHGFEPFLQFELRRVHVISVRRIDNRNSKEMGSGLTHFAEDLPTSSSILPGSLNLGSAIVKSTPFLP